MKAEPVKWMRWTAFALGALMPLAYAPYDYPWLAVAALAGWLWLLCREASPFRSGFWFGLGWFGTGAWWLAPTLHTFGHLPWALAAFCVLLVGVVMAMLPALWGWAAVKSGGRTHWLLITFPLAAVAEEWLRGHIFTGLPWTALGNLMLDTPAIGWAAWVGVYGISLLPALVAASLLFVLSHEEKRWGTVAFLVSVGLVMFAPAPYAGDGKGHIAALVQGNIPQDQKWDADFLNETMERYAGLSAASAGQAEVLVWPEAAVPFFLERAPDWDRWLREQVFQWQTPLLFGGLKVVDGEVANNGLFAAEPGGERAFAGKQHLVPFGEYVPEWIPFLHKLVPEIADFRPATDSGVVEADGIRYGALICYESLFPEQARARVAAGAQVLVNVTNDAWYGTTPAAWQHFQAARMRAVESGRYVLRAANTGVTALIGPNGRVLAELPWWQQGALEGAFELSDAITPYVRYGDRALLLCLILVIIPLVRRRGEHV